MNLLYSTVNTLRDRYAPAKHTSTFRATGEITPKEFVAAGDYLVYKFPTWSWADAEPASRRAAHLPPGKQFLVTRNVPCRRRLSDDDMGGGGGDGDDVEDGWLRTGGGGGGGSGDIGGGTSSRGEDTLGARLDDAAAAPVDDIPDMDEEDDDEAILPDVADIQGGPRSYTMYIMYSPYYRTPRLYLSGYRADGLPLPPHRMMDDIVGDYQDKTVTLEDFPFFAHTTKMASVHPCKHAPVMKTLLDRADSALKRRRARLAAAATGAAGSTGGGGTTSDEWEEVHAGVDDDGDDEVAIRVDQYLVVFLKFIASVTPGIEHDFTMSV